MNSKMTAEELRWQARDDARTLAAAEAIKNDPERLIRAHQSAKELLDERAKELEGLSKVAKNKTVDKAIKTAKAHEKDEQNSMMSTGNGFRTRRPNPATIGKLF
jgi:hypothetical protein